MPSNQHTGHPSPAPKPTASSFCCELCGLIPPAFQALPDSQVTVANSLLWPAVQEVEACAPEASPGTVPWEGKVWPMEA